MYSLREFAVVRHIIHQGAEIHKGRAVLLPVRRFVFLALIQHYRLISSVCIHGNFRGKRRHTCSPTKGRCAETSGQSDTCAAAGWRMQRLGRGIIQRQLQKNPPQTDRQESLPRFPWQHTCSSPQYRPWMLKKAVCPSVWEEEPWDTKTKEAF